MEVIQVQMEQISSQVKQVVQQTKNIGLSSEKVEKLLLQLSEEVSVPEQMFASRMQLKEQPSHPPAHFQSSYMEKTVGGQKSEKKPDLKAKAH